ncbi:MULTISPECIES: hypothetical protein [unclassified Sporosarcina]
MNEEVTKLSDLLLQSLYSYHFATNGDSYIPPKAMRGADVYSNTEAVNL